MDAWKNARETYAQGGCTHRELSERFDLPLSTLRRKAAAEHWSRLRKQRSGVGSIDTQWSADVQQSSRLSLTDRLMAVLSRVLENDEELYSYAEPQKNGGYLVERLSIINLDRLIKLTKLTADLFELQRTALGLHDYKDELSALKLEQDKELSSRKLEQELLLSTKKLELELMKLEGVPDEGVDDGFMEALGLGGETASEDAVNA